MYDIVRLCCHVQKVEAANNCLAFQKPTTKGRKRMETDLISKSFYNMHMVKTSRLEGLSWNTRKDLRVSKSGTTFWELLNRARWQN